MNCEQAKERLDLAFGLSELGEDLTAHLDGCPDCAAYWSEIRSLVRVLPADEDFFPSDEDRAMAVEGVLAELGPDRAPGLLARLRRWWTVSWNWRPVPVAATACVALLAALVLIQPNPAPSLGESEVTTALLLTSEADLEAYSEMEESDFESLLEAYNTRLGGLPSEGLLDDLTEDEYEYLLNSFDVGEIL